jgi:hypothetical protein
LEKWLLSYSSMAAKAAAAATPTFRSFVLAPPVNVGWLLDTVLVPVAPATPEGLWGTKSVIGIRDKPMVTYTVVE